MPHTSYSDVRSLPDPLLSYNFDLIIPNLPGGGDTKRLTIKCQSTSIPGTSVDDVTVSLHGIDLKFAGRQMWSHTLQATYLETRDMGTRFAIKSWIEFCRNARLNSGNYKANYATIADLVLYDDTGKTVRTVRMEGFFPQTMDDGAVDGTSSTAVTIGVTWAYDAAFDVG